MNNQLTLTPPAASDSADVLGIRFRRQRDRYRHSLCLFPSSGESIPILDSMEGDGEEEWPPSPPLQDVSLEERKGFSVALGVGRAGGAHWASSFMTVPATKDDLMGGVESGGLEIEHACRFNPAAGAASLAASYRLHSDWSLERVDVAASSGVSSSVPKASDFTRGNSTPVATLSHPDWSGIIVLTALAESPEQPGSAGSTRLEAQQEGLEWAISARFVQEVTADKVVTASWGLRVQMVWFPGPKPTSRI